MAWSLKLTDMGEFEDATVNFRITFPSFCILEIRDWNHQRRRKRRKRCFTYNPHSQDFPPGLCVCVCVCVCVHVYLYPTLCHPIDHSSPVSSVYEVLQARILEWVAISYSGHLSDPGIKPMSLASPVDSLPLCHLGNREFYTESLIEV